MRIIAGKARGRRLAAPPGRGTRPLTDRVKEAVFSALGDKVPGARVLDLYAGSGSIGLEALSRGAAEVVFVESSPAAVQVLRKNLAATALEGGRVAARDVARYLAGVGEERFDLVFVDPPWDLGQEELEEVVTSAAISAAPGAVMVVHRRAGGMASPVPPGWELASERRYGDSAVYRLTPSRS
jgi:16S rRNA (guanine966-N2)-methyltransferase